MSRVVGFSVLILALAGCGGDARVELAASEGLDQIAREMELALAEYHTETQKADDGRETDIVEAFIDRLKTDVEDEELVGGHVEAFRAALGAVRSDRAVEWNRHTAAMDNVAVLREMTADLRTLAVQSLALQDETRRYLNGILATRSRDGGVKPALNASP